MRIFVQAAALLFSLPSVAIAASPERVFQIASKSIVVVHTLNETNEQISQGSGIVVADEEVVTNCHVLELGTSFQVHVGGDVFRSTILGANWDSDLCLLTVPGLGVPSAKIGSSGSLNVGSRVFAVGSPRGLDLSLSEGIVSQLRKETTYPLIQTTAAISPGSSGGGLFDDEGFLIGITTFYIEGGQNLNFALPIEWVSGIDRSTTVSLPAQAAQIPENVLLIQAYELQEQKQWNALLEFGARWTERDPSNKWGWFFRGNVFWYTQYFGKAVPEYQRALRADPNFAQAWQSLGSCYTYLDRPLDSEFAHKKAVSLDPDSEMGWYGLGRAYADLGRFDDAERTVDRLKQIDRDTALQLESLISSRKRYEKRRKGAAEIGLYLPEHSYSSIRK